MPPDDGLRKRSRRISRACDYCHHRSIKCRPGPDGGACQNCLEFGQPCTFKRQSKRRGIRPGSRSQAFSDTVVPDANDSRSRGQETRSRLPQSEVERDSYPQSSNESYEVSHSEDRRRVLSPLSSTLQTHTSSKWRAPYITSQATVMDLVELYFEIVYPIFPLYHQPSFIRSISRGEYTTKRSLFADTMAICALVSARVRDKAVFNPGWDTTSLQETEPEVFYREASRQTASDDIVADLNLMRAHAVLSITAIQHGKIRDMHQHLGRYHALVAMDGLHDEANWPKGIGIVETEERRRLFWSIYTLDVYTSIVWNGVVRSREQQSDVSYPTEMDDDLFSDSGFSSRESTSPSILHPSPGRDGVRIRTSSWLCGWNFVTDLYRVLEHVIPCFRDRRSRARERSLLRNIFKDDSTLSQDSVRDRIMTTYSSLPQCFKESPPVCYDVRQDRYGFQAANITATIQLLRMVLFTVAGASIQDRCQIANEVISAFITIPVAYLQAISSPLMHHLGGIGAILGSVFEERLSEADYDLVRSVLLALVQLLSNLEVMHSSAGASEKLQLQITRIDEYMDRQRSAAQHLQRSHLLTARRVSQVHIQPPTMNFSEHGSSLGTDDHVSSFQVPPDIVDDLTWIFDFAPSYN